MEQTVKEIIQAIFPISSDSMQLILNALTFETIAEHDILFKANRINQKEYFVLKGVLHSYATNPHDEESSISFYDEGSIIIPHTVRSKDDISIMNAKALCACEVASIDSSFFEQLMIEKVDIRLFGNTVMRQELLRKTEKEINLASLSAKERLIRFRTDYPNLENKIQQTHIASYLGITPISLSRLRSSM